MTNRIGIMQGRLSGPRATLQSFPWRDWREEFVRARALGFGAIEWLFDAEDHQRNPIWSEAGIDDICSQIQETGIAVPSLCASYFLHHPFFRVSESERRSSVGILNELVRRASRLSARVILLPVLEAAGIHARSERAQLLESLREALDLAQIHGIALALETDLPAPEQIALAAEAQHPALGLYYDTGNATAEGHDIAVDIQVIAPFLCGVHIKDRPHGGPNVALGTGDADFDTFFPTLRSLGYEGPLILETTPGDDYLENARRNLEFVEEVLERTAV
jgi:hexulose-6-phosphate isomerase